MTNVDIMQLAKEYQEMREYEDLMQTVYMLMRRILPRTRLRRPIGRKYRSS